MAESKYVAPKLVIQKSEDASYVDQLLGSRSAQYSSTDSLLDPTSKTPPSDRYNYVYLTSLFLGVGTLLGYNVILTASDYLVHEFSQTIMFWIVPLYVLPDLIMMSQMISKRGRNLGFRVSMSVAFFMAFTTLFAVPIVVTSVSRAMGYGFVLLCSIIAGVYTAIIQAKSLAFTGEVEVKYLQACIAGQALAGIIACLLRILTKAAMPDKTVLGGVVYFVTGGFFHLLCLILFLSAMKTDFVRHRLAGYFMRVQKRRMKKLNMLSRSNSNLLASTPTVPVAYSPEPARPGGAFRGLGNELIRDKPQIIKARSTQSAYVKSTDGIDSAFDVAPELSPSFPTETPEIEKSESFSLSLSDDDKGDDEKQYRKEKKKDDTGTVKIIDKKQLMFNLKGTDSGFIYPPEALQKKEDAVSYKEVFAKIKKLCAALFVINMTTFLVFPGDVVTIESQYSSLNHNDWMPVILLTQYNVCDYIGRQFIASWTSFGATPDNLWVYGVVRLPLLYPLFLALYEKWIENDFAAYAAMLLMATSHGHLCCLAFMWASQRVKAHEQGTQAAIMSFFLVIGIAVGSYTALGLSYVL